MLNGPLKLVQGNYGNIARVPIFIPNATRNETWGTARTGERRQRGAKSGLWGVDNVWGPWACWQGSHMHASRRVSIHGSARARARPASAGLHVGAATNTLAAPPSGAAPDDCPPGLCYNTTYGDKFWGFATAIGPLDDLKSGNDSRLDLLKHKGYRWL